MEDSGLINQSKVSSMKRVSIIVDVDDKNCLAELTVVLEFNQSR